MSERKIVLHMRGDALSDGETLRPGAERFETPDRLPVLVPESVCHDESALTLPSLTRRVKDHTRERTVAGRELVADEWHNLLDSGALLNRAELARRLGVSQARVSQVISAR